MSATLPVRQSAQEGQGRILVAPRFDGHVYVSIPTSDGSVVARLDGNGKVRPGWPILLPGASPCGLLLPVEDGTVRVVCGVEESADGPLPLWAFAFDAVGKELPGWPVELPCCGPGSLLPGRIVGSELTVLARQYTASQIDVGQPAGNAWIMRIASDGTVRNGAQVPFVEDCCRDTWAVGPNGVAYGTVHHLSDTPSADLAAVGFPGVPRGFPIAIEGHVSGPAFDTPSRIHVTVGSPLEAPSQTLTFEPNGRAIDLGSNNLQIAATGEFVGIEGTSDPFPAAPLVAQDGTTYVIDKIGGTTVAAVGTAGEVVAGWPYRSNAPLESSCPVGAICEGASWVDPKVGGGNFLYVAHAASTTSVGGSIVAVRADGRVARGWPVTLQRPRSYFSSLAVITNGDDRSVYALAVESEAGDELSASILRIATDSTVLYTTTIIEP